MTVFFEDQDYRAYLRILREQTSKWGIAIWAYCLMPNHVHLIAVPPSGPALSRAIGEAHRRYAVRTNRPRQWSGHLWQERFGSCAMDAAHVFNAARYVLLNPVRARLAGHPVDWPYSSAAAHFRERGDPLIELEPLDRYVEDWQEYFNGAMDSEADEKVRRHSRSGRPLWSA